MHELMLECLCAAEAPPPPRHVPPLTPEEATPKFQSQARLLQWERSFPTAANQKLAHRDWPGVHTQAPIGSGACEGFIPAPLPPWGRSEGAACNPFAAEALPRPSPVPCGGRGGPAASRPCCRWRRSPGRSRCRACSGWGPKDAWASCWGPAAPPSSWPAGFPPRLPPSSPSCQGCQQTRAPPLMSAAFA